MTDREIIEQAWKNRELLKERACINAINDTIALLNRGEIRVCEKQQDDWVVNDWIKKAILLYFPICSMKKTNAGDLEFADKIATKKDYMEWGVRVVPPATARFGAFIAPGVILMPSYVNIGAYIDSGTMVDTWATVGSCAQIGKNVHLAGGVGIGGVLEPVGAKPVVIEDHCFIGSRCIVVEGARICEGAVLGANTVITASTKIIDVSGDTPKEYKAYVPANSVVIPGSITKHFPAGDYNVNCALIIGKRKESTDKKTSLNEALRQVNI
ncbi:MAG: 2,3,4,5-tetrahydropyridine-2,6-dicarboxylate N-succinyltransferase [Bacteroidales bacterium]|nr:2,3,4,5-tetrahydropyridine-2,6-dicarboxylate N-succinyltransferase [Bacteroidales bacterium]MBQ9312762.1 2,3,4,5-tetrahydropyridine-2,6-dicarboxylate N-succinyltransferase [Bacteroidales bacterium]